MRKSEFQNMVSDCQSIHRVFELQAETTPDVVAVILGDHQLTYRELDGRANQLAVHLQRMGVGPDKLVGLYVERSLNAVVGILGVLKAGGACLPLDPDCPMDRLSYMLSDGGVKVLITEGSMDEVSLDHHVDRVLLDRDWELIAQRGETKRLGDTTADQLAYVIYTSGSTGKPKGVSISHGAAVDHLQAIGRAYELSAFDRVLQFAALSFDVCFEQIFSALFRGATVVFRGPEMWSASDFSRICQEAALTVANLPTAFWHQWTDLEAAERLRACSNQLRMLIIGGETLLPASIRRWQQVSPDEVCLLNAYGPTEVTMTSSLFKLPAELCRDNQVWRVPIGRPVGNRSMLVLDAHGNLLPIGVPGVLHIGGDLLARGYLRRPDLTAEQFLPDPFRDSPGARIYRTGDLTCYLSEGNLDFLGRIDHQVKIRGFRIELGEIEAVLTQHASVREAVVIVHDRPPEEKRLVAYVVSDRDSNGMASILIEFLRERLPAYMVPFSILFLETLPRNLHGKVDRAMLPDPDRILKQRTETGDSVAPCSAAEQQVASIWAKVLNLEHVGLHDNFFDLGGHSLLATKLASRLCESFRVEIQPRDLFKAPTVAETVKHISELLGSREIVEEIARATKAVEELSDEEIMQALSGQEVSK